VDAYAWHLNQLRSGDRTYREYEASGNVGQLLMMIPELELVFVFTAGNCGQGGIWAASATRSCRRRSSRRAGGSRLQRRATSPVALVMARPSLHTTFVDTLAGRP
jgi:hypothetical protein